MTVRRLINKAQPAGKQGFTLVELLIIIAFIAVLAGVLLVAINPVQQLAKARDTGRISAIAQMGKSLEAYGANNNSVYVAETPTWLDSLKTAGELSVLPSTITYGSTAIVPCTTGATATGGVQNQYCYQATGATLLDAAGPVVAYTRLEATANISKCTGAGPWNAYFVYSSFDGKAGFVCFTQASATEPSPGAQTFIP